MYFEKCDIGPKCNSRMYFHISQIRLSRRLRRHVRHLTLLVFYHFFGHDLLHLVLNRICETLHRGRELLDYLFVYLVYDRVAQLVVLDNLARRSGVPGALRSANLSGLVHLVLLVVADGGRLGG